ncbi:MAG: hypothetical protein ACYDEE_16570 [Ignavibacteriaceae bacterium]
MSEMIGNQYFLVRQYNLAAKEFENSIHAEDYNVQILQKLIICYTMVNKPGKALNLFLSLINNNIDLIINQKNESINYPCKEIILRIENGEVGYEDDFTFFYVLGMLNFFCDLNNSLKYFQKANKINSKDIRITIIIKMLKKKLVKLN